MEPDLLAASTALIQRSDFVYVSTIHDSDGFPETRVMFNLLKLRAEVLKSGPARLSHPFATWLGTNTSSQKVSQLRVDPRVCLYYADTASFEGLMLQGKVSEVRDSAILEALWMSGWEMYYPGGLHGGDFTILQFSPLRGRFYHGLKVQEFDASKEACQ